MSFPPDVVKSEECLEKQIEGLLHYFNTHHDHNAALKIVKLESLLVERDSVKLEQIEEPSTSSQEMSSGSSKVSGLNSPHNEGKGCYSDKDSDCADNESDSLDESCIEEERNP